MAISHKNPGPIEFEAVIKRNKKVDNAAAWVDFPCDLKETYGKGNLVPILATFDGKVKYQGALAKMGGKHPILLLRKDIRAQICKQPGEKVKVKVELDTSERKIDLAKDEEKALKDAGLLEKFRGLAYSHQREYHQWIEEAKKPETRARRVEKMLRMLKSNQKEPH